MFIEVRGSCHCLVSVPTDHPPLLSLTKDTCDASGVKCPNTCRVAEPFTFVAVPDAETVAPMTLLREFAPELGVSVKFVVVPFSVAVPLAEMPKLLSCVTCNIKAEPSERDPL